MPFGSPLSTACANADVIHVQALLWGPSLGGATFWWFDLPASQPPASPKDAEAPAPTAPKSREPILVATPKTPEAPAPIFVSPAPSAPSALIGPVSEAQFAADGAAAPHADLRKSLATAIPELVRLLQADDQPNLFREFTPLDAKLANMRLMHIDGLPVTSINQAADHVRQNPTMMADDIEVLGAIQGQALNPTLSSNGTTATYALPSPVRNWVTVVFEKKGGFWYLKSMTGQKYGAMD